MKQAEFTDEAIATTSGQVVVFSRIAKEHIEYGHKEPGKGSVFATFELSLIAQALGLFTFSPSKKVYEVQVPKVGYDLVLPTAKAVQLPDARRVNVEKEEQGKPIVVSGYRTSQNIEDFLQDTMSIVVLQTLQLNFVPESLAKEPKILKAIKDQVLYSVVSSWPGRGDVPPASQWGEDWAVVIPNVDDV